MAINATFVALNTLRVLSILSLALSIATCVMVNVKGFPNLGHSNTLFQFINRTIIALEALLMTVFASCAVAVSVSNASSATTIVNFFDIETSSYRNVIQVKSRGSVQSRPREGTNILRINLKNQQSPISHRQFVTSICN